MWVCAQRRHLLWLWATQSCIARPHWEQKVERGARDASLNLSCSIPPSVCLLPLPLSPTFPFLPFLFLLNLFLAFVFLFFFAAVNYLVIQGHETSTFEMSIHSLNKTFPGSFLAQIARSLFWYFRHLRLCSYWFPLISDCWHTTLWDFSNCYPVKQSNKYLLWLYVHSTVLVT